MQTLSAEWGPHIYYDAPVRTDEIMNDPHFPIFALMRKLFLYSMGSLPPLEVDEPSDLHIARCVLARLTAKAADPGEFQNFSHEQGLHDRPSELIRKYTLDHLQSFLSFSGILHSLEIAKISKPNWGEIPAYMYNIEPKSLLLTYRESIEQIRYWKSQGYTIGAFQGAFDPPTMSHLMNATSCYYWAQLHGYKLKLIWIFDNNQLIKRKGESRPRYPNLSARRNAVQGLWNVPLTVESRVRNEHDLYQYIHEFGNLGIEYVFVTEEVSNFRLRRWTAEQAGAELITVPYMEGVPTSTDIVKFTETFKSMRSVPT